MNYYWNASNNIIHTKKQNQMKWIIILLAFIGSWEQMKAQQNPIILNEKNVTDLTTAADWDKLIDTWNYVPLENSEPTRLYRNMLYLW